MLHTPFQPSAPICRAVVCAAFLAVLAAGVPHCSAQEVGAAGEAGAAEEVGALVKLRLPLQGAADQSFQGVLRRAADKLARSAAANGGGRPTLIIEFAGDTAAGGSEFERCLSLARFLLRDMTDVKTIAYLPRTVRGHAVLAALACEEVAMAPDAEIGDAGADEDPSRPLEPGVAAVYEEIAVARRNFPAPVALGMVDRRIEVLRVEDETGVDFVLASQLEQFKAERAVVDTEVLSAAGSPAVLTGREAREFGFVKYLVGSDQALARVLSLPEDAVREDQSTLAAWRPAIIELSGELTPRRLKQVKTLIGSEIDQHGVNWIGLRINSGGGQMELCIDLAATLAELDESEVRTVAYVPVEAAGGAALVALACDQLVMHPGATLGGGITAAPAAQEGAPARRLPPPGPPGPPPGPEDPPPANPNELSHEQLEAALAGIRGPLAEKSGRGWSLLAATIDPGLTLHEYSNRETGGTALFSAEELNARDDAEQWRQGEEVTAPGAVLALDAARAEELGVAFAVVDSYDGLKQLYGFETDPPLARPNWALELVEALANPWLAGVLLLVAFGGMLFEFHTPGLGVGAFVSSVAFLLFFWSHFLSGTAEWLEVLLFLAGVAFILMEAFVLPGFGIFGLGGIGMVLASLVLVSQTFVIPRTSGQLAELRGSLTMVVLSVLGCLIAAFMLRRYLPHAPGVRMMMLAPADEVELAELEHREALVDYTHLIGRTGEAATNLMPSGKAEIGGELLDVTAEGQVIDRGEAIVVVKAKGSRVLVRRKT